MADGPQTERCGEDGRTKAIVLINAGATAFKAAWPVYTRAIEKHFARYFDEHASGTILVTMERVLNAAGNETSDDGAV